MTTPATATRAFFGFPGLIDPTRHRDYNAWHQLDHRPENLALPGVIHGDRWVRSPAGRAVGTADDTYEQDLRVLPTFATVAGRGISARGVGPGALALSGVDIDLRRLLHAGQSVTVHRPLPPAGTAIVSSRISEVWDKGKAALLVLESTATDDTNSPLWTNRMRVWARGEGGFGGEPGHEPSSEPPDREPDVVLDSPTSAGQALLYRLNGDLNPLHADPSTARAAGFERPILHGLASYGITAKALVDSLLDGDPTRLAALSVRFAGSLFPGQTIRTRVWRDGTGFRLLSTCPERDDAPVLTHASAVLAPWSRSEADRGRLSPPAPRRYGSPRMMPRPLVAT